MYQITICVHICVVIINNLLIIMTAMMIYFANSRYLLINTDENITIHIYTDYSKIESSSKNNIIK